MNRAIVLHQHSSHLPQERDFKMVSLPDPVVKMGQVLIKPIYFSVDPYMCTRMQEAGCSAETYVLGEPLIGGGVGRVVETKSTLFAPGDYVYGLLPWQESIVVKDTQIEPIDVEGVYPSMYLGLLGLTGLTAYFGYKKFAHAQSAETIVISAAAGAVGHIVGQLARIDGCRVIGIASASEKRDFLKQNLGFDEVLDYQDIHQLKVQLQQSAPLGVDIYFDNVGGKVSDCILPLLNHKARVIVCGQIAAYNSLDHFQGPYPQLHLLHKSASMVGFMINDFLSEVDEARAVLLKLYQEQRIRDIQTIEPGFENLPKALVNLFEGLNLGKMIVEV